MKKWAYLAWMLLMMPQPTTIEMRFVESTLEIKTEASFIGTLYLDDEYVMEVNQPIVKIEDIKTGIYSLYDVNGELVQQMINPDDKPHVAFSHRPIRRKKNNYLFNQEPTTYIISKEPFESLELTTENEEFFYYEINDFEFKILEEYYHLFIDDTAPVVSVKDCLQLQENTFLTNQELIQIIYEDDAVEPFILYPHKIIDVALEEGENDLSSYLMDLAMNSSQNELTVIKDSKAPIINSQFEKYYINHPLVLSIDEPYLDFTKSYYTSNDKITYITKNEIILDQSGMVECYLYDLAGNENYYEFEVIYDKQAPVFRLNVENNRLNLVFNEALSKENITLITPTNQMLHMIEPYELVEEGVYQLTGDIIDLSGNITTINQTYLHDLNEPKITINLDQELYLESPQVDIVIEDTSDLIWKIDVYRNQQHLNTYQGKEATTQSITLKEEDYLDGYGEYEIKVFADDGLHQVEQAKSCLVDVGCAPISIHIDGYDASQVTSLLINKDYVFNAKCLETTVDYQLVYEDGTVKTGNGEKVVLSQNHRYESLTFHAKDNNGYKLSHTITFSYPEMILSPLQEESIVEKETVPIIEEEQRIENEKTIVEEKKPFPTLFVIGGILIGIIAVRFIASRKVRSSQNDTDLPTDQTISLYNSQDTLLLSVREDSK